MGFYQIAGYLWQEKMTNYTQEFNIARVHTVWSLFELFLEYVIVALPFFRHLWTNKSTDTASFAVLSVNKYKVFIFHQLL